MQGANELVFVLQERRAIRKASGSKSAVLLFYERRSSGEIYSLVEKSTDWHESSGSVGEFACC